MSGVKCIFALTWPPEGDGKRTPITSTERATKYPPSGRVRLTHNDPSNAFLVVTCNRGRKERSTDRRQLSPRFNSNRVRIDRRQAHTQRTSTAHSHIHSTERFTGQRQGKPTGLPPPMATITSMVMRALLAQRMRH